MSEFPNVEPRKKLIITFDDEPEAVSPEVAAPASAPSSVASPRDETNMSSMTFGSMTRVIVGEYWYWVVTHAPLSRFALLIRRPLTSCVVWVSLLLGSVMVLVKNVGALGVLIVILLIRPQGILGRRERIG